MSNQTITSPKGFLAAGITAGIKKSGKKDMGLIVCPTGAVAAAVTTTNKIFAAPVAVCREHAKSKEIDAVIVNSGCANACTGKKGLKNALTMCKTVADLIDSEPENVLIASTGIIGHQLEMDKITAGIKAADQALSADEQAGSDFAHAIMTTDTKTKQAHRRFKIGKKTVTIAATTKGAGMIGPNMATTLTFITTDAAISKPMLKKALQHAIGNSLNKLTVDGHQSTNDTAVILASKLAGNAPIKKADADFEKFCKELDAISDDLARQMAIDAEGATRYFKVKIVDAASREDAAKAARAVADYDLFKCAVNGSDPNWGRIICAVGSSQVKLDPEKVCCKIDRITVFRNGQPTKFDAAKASAALQKEYHEITVSLGTGDKSDFCYGCDLSRDYVTINADYHT